MIGLSVPQYDQALIFHPSMIGCFWSQYERTFIVNTAYDWYDMNIVKLNKSESETRLIRPGHAENWQQGKPETLRLT